MQLGLAPNLGRLSFCLRNVREKAMTQENTAEARNELAAKYFPKQWEKVADKPGASKARQNLRRAADNRVKLDALRQDGACCGKCGSFERVAPSSMPDFGCWCAADSDFHGYTKASAGGLCLRFHEAGKI